MNLLGAAKAVSNTEFRARVTAAMLITAIEVSNEKLPTGHPRDLAALMIIQSPEANEYMTKFMWLVATSDEIADTISSTGVTTATDQIIMSVVSRVWNVLYPFDANV